MARKWIQAANVEIDDATGALLVQQTGTGASGAANVSNISASTAEVTLMPANSSRRGGVIENASTATLYVKFGTGVSDNSYTYKLSANGVLELPDGLYSGIVTGVWSNIDGQARVTEVS